MTDLTRAALAARIDHTLLRPEATSGDIRALAEAANRYSVAAACVHPNRVRLLSGALAGPLVCAVAGFPTGAHRAELVAAEATAAVNDGADEIDMVVDLGAVADGDFAAVRAAVEQVRAAVPDTVLKVIVESAVWSRAQLAAVCSAVVDGGADFVKTSSGFHPAGGASVEAVTLMAAIAHPRGARVKASGGVRTLGDAVAMLEAGADRIGCSVTAEILGQLTG